MVSTNSSQNSSIIFVNSSLKFINNGAYLGVRRNLQVKLSDFVESTVETFLALCSLITDALFWVCWAYVTKWSGALIESLKISSNEVWPYKIAQWCGCGVLAVFAILNTLKNLISLCDRFRAYLGERSHKKNKLEGGESKNE